MIGTIDLEDILLDCADDTSTTSIAERSSFKPAEWTRIQNTFSGFLLASIQ